MYKCCRWKARSSTYSECILVALGVQHARLMRHITFPNVSCLIVHCFPRYLTNGTISRTRYWTHKYVFRFSLQILSETFLILRRTEPNGSLSQVPAGIHVQYPLLLSSFKETNFLDRVSKSTRTLNFMDRFPVGAEFFHETRRDGRTDGQKDVTKLIVAFRNFVNVSKMSGTIPPFSSTAIWLVQGHFYLSS